MLLWAAAAAGAEPGVVPDWSPGGEPPAIEAASPAPVFGCPIPAPPGLEPLPEGTSSESIDILSGGAEVDLNGLADFKDNLVIRRGDTQLRADGARFDRQTGQF
jgi:hypothetical protein